MGCLLSRWCCAYLVLVVGCVVVAVPESGAREDHSPQSPRDSAPTPHSFTQTHKNLSQDRPPLTRLVSRLCLPVRVPVRPWPTVSTPCLAPCPLYPDPTSPAAPPCPSPLAPGRGLRCAGRGAGSGPTDATATHSSHCPHYTPVPTIHIYTQTPFSVTHPAIKRGLKCLTNLSVGGEVPVGVYGKGQPRPSHR